MISALPPNRSSSSRALSAPALFGKGLQASPTSAPSMADSFAPQFGGRSRKPNTSLLDAADAGRFEELPALLKKARPEDLALQDVAGRTIVHRVAARGDAALIQKLFNKNFGILDIQDEEGRTALHEAVEAGRADVVEALLKCSASADKADRDGNIPLHLAAKQGDMSILQLLTENGDLSYMTNQKQQTPLHLAVVNRHPEAVAFFIHHTRSNLNAPDSSGSTPVHNAASSRNLESLQLLLKGRSPGSRGQADDPNRAGQTPLGIAAHYGDVEMMQALMEYGADPLKHGQANHTPLHWAAASGNPQAVQLIYDNLAAQYADLPDQAERLQAAINIPGSSGQTPMITAAVKNDGQMLGLLHERGADLNAQDQNGWTAMVWAAKMASVDALRTLRDLGADPLAGSLRPSAIAKTYGWTQLSEDLRKLERQARRQQKAASQ